ncbi:hypothetical protein J437_LFUL007559 [Ladona fulva]|uniref:Endoplasmic reticulum junction formation protein lunapark n=1 Tax=Ladona fulva TaxID=123851 RepID=A0A8K0JUW9_LADFU|nr:hypothetical protein J437_LFUL007559 [Ladona fulva]
MGVIFSRKKKKSTKETLEDLEKDIRKIEEFRQHTEQKQKRTIGKLLLYGIPLYGLFVAGIYFYELPTSLYGKACIVSLLLCLPVLFFFIRRGLKWYFRRQIRHNEDKLSELLAKKKKILEDVMETETYKVAKEILEKFAPDQLRNKNSSNGNQENSFIQNYSRSQITPQPGSELRRRIVPAQGSAPGRSPPQSLPRPQVIQRSPPYGPGVGRGMPPAQMHTPYPPNAQPGFVRGGIMPPPGPPMPRPIPPYERSFVDRMIEYLIGDGPNKRYALICRQCESHNGMALQEEFEYLAFRCCYCYYWNPARKQRPQAPRLPLPTPTPSIGGQEKERGEESVSEEDGSEETSSEGPSGDPRDPPDGNARDSEEDACTDSGDAASKEESSHRESLPAAEDNSDANFQELTGSEGTPASSSSVSPSTEEGSGGPPPLIEMQNVTSAESGGSSGSPVIEEQVMEELMPSIQTKQD